MNHQQIRLFTLIVTALSVITAPVQAMDTELPAMDAASALSLGLPELNGNLGTYAYQGLPAAQAHVKDAELNDYLGRLGMRHTWQMAMYSDLYDAWYSADADITVIVIHDMQDSNAMSESAYAVQGRVRKGQQAIW